MAGSGTRVGSTITLHVDPTKVQSASGIVTGTGSVSTATAIWGEQRQFLDLSADSAYAQAATIAHHKATTAGIAGVATCVTRIVRLVSRQASPAAHPA
mgnify:CR=1 FL=1